MKWLFRISMGLCLHLPFTGFGQIPTTGAVDIDAPRLSEIISAHVGADSLLVKKLNFRAQYCTYKKSGTVVRYETLHNCLVAYLVDYVKHPDQIGDIVVSLFWPQDDYFGSRPAPSLVRLTWKPFQIEHLAGKWFAPRILGKIKAILGSPLNHHFILEPEEPVHVFRILSRNLIQAESLMQASPNLTLKKIEIKLDDLKDKAQLAEHRKDGAWRVAAGIISIVPEDSRIPQFDFDGQFGIYKNNLTVKDVSFDLNLRVTP